MDRPRPLMLKPLKKEIHFFINTLAGLLKSMEEQYTVIDLHNEASLSGKIAYVDGFMNVDLEDVVYHDSRGFVHQFEKFFVRGRLIRYVHIPKHLSPLELFKKNIEQPVRKTVKKVVTIKKKRAQRYHDEIVQSAYGKTVTDESK